MSSTKKQKLTPIRALKNGENMADMKLFVVASEAPRKVQGKSVVWTIVGSDGFDYIDISFWDRNYQILSRELQDPHGKQYFFKTFMVREIPELYNFRSVRYELRAQEGSTVSSIEDYDGQGHEPIAFHTSLAFKCALDGSVTFKPTEIAKLRDGETGFALHTEIVKVHEIRTVQNKELKSASKVLDIEVKDGSQKSKLTAWNIMAEMLYWKLLGKEGTFLKLRSVTMKNNQTYGGKSFTFTIASQFEIEENVEEFDDVDANVPQKLAELKASETFVKCEIRVRVMREQSMMRTPMQIDGTVVCDGVHRAQMLFPSSLKLPYQSEVSIIKTAKVEINASGVLTITVSARDSFVFHGEKTLGKLELDEFDYPEAEDVKEEREEKEEMDDEENGEEENEEKEEKEEVELDEGKKKVFVENVKEELEEKEDEEEETKGTKKKMNLRRKKN